MLCLVLFLPHRPVALRDTFFRWHGVGRWIAQSWLSHARGRIQTWLDPFTDPTGAGWQPCRGSQACLPVAFGAGFGKGNPERIPIAESDFIYAVIGEELGFAGCVVLVSFYLIFFHQCYRVAIQCKDTFDPFWRLASLPFGPVRPCSTWRRHQGHPHDRHSIAVGQPWWEQSGNRVYRPGIVAQSIRIRRTLSIEGLQTAAQTIEQPEIRLTLQCSSPIKARVSAPQKRRSSAFARRAFQRLHGLHRA